MTTGKGASVSILTRDPIGTDQRDAGDRGGFHRERDEIFRFKVMDVTLAAGAGDGLGFQRQHREKIGQSPAAENWIEPFCQFRILRRDTGGIAAFVYCTSNMQGLAPLPEDPGFPLA